MRRNLVWIPVTSDRIAGLHRWCATDEVVHTIQLLRFLDRPDVGSSSMDTSFILPACERGSPAARLIE
jgi:hypothetical protein